MRAPGLGGPWGGAAGLWRAMGAADSSALGWQVWETVPYLASYVSPVLKEHRAVPLEPRQLEVTWNGLWGFHRTGGGAAAS